jgi:hypothetical protein
MKAVSLLLVLVVAKLAILNGHTVPLSFWTPIAYLWQDVLVVLLFALVEMAVRRVGLLYWGLAIYAALNIPVGRAVSTPLTWPMLRAARGPLADSILLYVTWTNAALVLLTLGVAAIGPFLLRTLPRRALMLGLPIVALGPIASARVETLGLDRNALAVLVSSALSRSYSQAPSGDWRVSRFDHERVEDLSMLRGIAKDRNIILISLESTAAQYLPLYGSSEPVTPNLNVLATHAVVFDNAYAVYPESIKGLLSILCSIYPAFDSRPESYEGAPCRSVAAVLANSGYRTGLFHSGRFAYLGMESIIRNRGYQALEDAGDIGGNHNSSFGVDEPATVTRILSWIDAGPRDRPFFLTYLPIAGHHPYETPERGPFPDREEIGRYRNALLYGDASLGALVEGVRARGLADKTVWIILGDHGEAFGQHEGNYGHTFFLYDENIRVPFLIAVPGLKQRRVHKVVSLVDTAPTIVDLMGIAAPDGYRGRSMLDDVPRMALFFTDYSMGMLGLRDGPWKFIYEVDSGRSRLYDIDKDPGETRDISAGNSDRVAWYAEVVRRWIGLEKKSGALTYQPTA